MSEPAFTVELKFRTEGSSLWDKGKYIFHEKLKTEEGGALAHVQQFLSATTTIKQVLEVGENTRKKAEGKYSGRIGKILRKMQFFAQFGDIAIQHNPETTALVWAAFRMMLQLAVHDLETCELLTSACDDIAGTIFVCEVYERRYIQVMHGEESDIAQKVVERIPSVYAIILEFSYEATRHLNRGKVSRFLKAGENTNFMRLLNDIKKASVDVNELASLAFEKDVLKTLGEVAHQSREAFEEIRNLMSTIIDENKQIFQKSHMDQKAGAEAKDRDRVEAEYEKNIKWLDRLEDPSYQYRTNNNLRQPNTCTWIFVNKEYKRWYRSGSSNMLWVVGNAGFGKSVLLSSVIKELRKADDGRIVLFFFCKTGDDSTQRAGAIFRNLIAQIYQKIHDNFPELLEESTKILANAQNQGGLAKGDLEYAKSVKNLKPALQDLAKLHGKPVFIIIDGLDECNDRGKEGLANSLCGMIGASSNIKILVASRPETDLLQEFEETLKIEVGHNNNTSADIKAYLVEELNKLSSCTPKERKTALKEIIKRSAGMFRYANLAVDGLRRPWRRPIEKHLATFPDGLEAFYQQRFQQTGLELREVLVMTLRWTILAKGDVTPLIVAEDYRRVFDNDEDDGDDNGSNETSSDEGDGEEWDNEEIGEEVMATGGARVGEGQKAEDDNIRKEAEDGNDLGADPTDNPEKSEDDNLAAGGNGEANIKSTDESNGMLNDTLKHIQEAGSVFIESTDRNAPLRLRHTSVKDFVLKESSKYASIRRELLCPQCASNENEQLSITPKDGHLILSLTIFTHLNSKTFMGHYLPPIDATGESETDSEDDSEEEEGGEGGGGVSEADSDYSPESEESESDSGDASETPCRYELANWMYHLQEAERLWTPEEREGNEDWNKLWGLVENFLCDSPAEFKCWQYKVWSEYPYHFDKDSVSEAIHVASFYGLTGLVSRFLKKGQNVNLVNGDGITPLHLAALSQDPDLVKLLLEHGADADAKDFNQTTPLGNVSSKLNGSPEIAKLLLDHGATVETSDSVGVTPLHDACQNGNVEIFRQLIKKGANVKAQDEIGETPLHKALRRADPPSELIEELIQHGANVNEQDHQSQAPLYEAAELGSAAAVSILLRVGANVNDDDEIGTTALHIAAASGHRAVVDLLIENGADLNAKDHKGKTALALAAQNGRGDVVSYLIEKQTTQDPARSYLVVADAQGRTALHRAAAKGYTEIVTKLLDAGNPSSGPTQLQGTNLAATPLHPAAFGGHVKVVELLVKHGCDINALNRNGQTPLDLAVTQWGVCYETRREAMHDCIWAIIKSHPKTAVDNWKLFRTAIYHNSVDVVTNILDQGVDPNALDEHGWSPLAIAKQILKSRAINDVVQVLKSRGAKEFGVPGEANGMPVLGQPPTLMNRNDKGPIVNVSEDGLELRSLRPESSEHFGSIRANHPIPQGEYTFYFEVELQKVIEFKSDYPLVAIGIATETMSLEEQMPGWSDLGDSIAYHGDDGMLFSGGDEGKVYGPTYSAGDVVGCGVDFVNNCIFFTKNGEFLGFRSIVTGLVYYPVVCLGEDTVAKVNFGKDPSWPLRGYVLPDGITNTDGGGNGNGEAGGAPGEEGSPPAGGGGKTADPPPAKGE